MTGTTVAVRELWEEFRIREGKSKSLKTALTIFQLASSRKSVWALRDISFEISRGETVGLIGENGSGKSTLLRCIAGILQPTRGEVLVGGTISSLIEVGVDFATELTGRENVMVNGALFGLTRKQLRERFDSIVAFAELEDVVERPVRAYSSGMKVRLAFSLAVHVEPTILLIDEALAVGDEAFQRKCAQRVAELGSSGVTIIFVSHDLPLVKQVCQRTLLLQEGSLIADGETDQVIEKYLSLEKQKQSSGRGNP